MSFQPPCNSNVLLCADSYKVSHHMQYPPDTTTIYSYFESRGGLYNETVFFGLQYIIKQWMEGVVVTEEKIQEAKELYEKHFGKNLLNEDGWRYIVKEHGGRLPLRVCSVLEGSVVPVKNVLFSVENTDKKVPWLTNWFEGLMVQVWYPLTVATNSREQKKILAEFLSATADNLGSLPFKLHDFGFRGVSSCETAAIGGASHLVNFMGTDTIAGLVMARRFYGCDMAGFSIPAAEHSTITSWGRTHELEAFRNMLEAFPTGLVAVVSDSYDIWNALSSLWGDKLKDLIIKRGDVQGALVVRPDSGDPPEIVVKSLELLGKAFGTTKNSKGYKMLPSYIRLIQGDGINAESLRSVLEHAEAFGWSAENIVFGSGGALLQKLHRDTQKCAFKCSFATVGGEDREVYKQPITDSGKKSKRGRLALVRDGNGQWSTVESVTAPVAGDKLVPIFENGKLLVNQTFDEIRKLAEVPAAAPLRKMTTCSFPVAGKPCALCNREVYDAWAKQWL